jgi:O-antigen/teichoic acid export membrane protein
MGLRQRFKKLFSGSFVRDVAKLSLGTLAGRFITIAALPLLTRIYSPDDFALLAAYMGIVSTIGVVSCLRFEIAIPLAEDDEDAKYLLVLALMALTAVSVLVFVFTLLLPQKIAHWSKQTDLQSYILMIPLGIASLGFYSVTQYWATRTRRFTEIAQSRLSQAVAGISASLSLGWAGITPFGLLVGNILNTSAGSLRLAYWSIKNERDKLTELSFQGFKETVYRYKHYPIYSTPEAFFNIAGVQVPIVLLAAYAGAEAGYLILAMQITVAPMSLLGRAISQVYVSRAPQAFKSGQLTGLTRQIIFRLLKIAFLPFLLLGMLAPWVVPYVFGAIWGRAGEIITWLVPWMLLQFLVSPVSMALHVMNQQGKAMTLQAIGLVLRVGVVFFAINELPLYVVEAYAVSGAAFYLIYLLVVFKSLKTRQY